MRENGAPSKVPTRRLPAALVLLLSLLAPPGVRAQWVEHGPGPNTQGQVEGIADREVVGAVNAAAAHPTDADTLYVGAVNGGIWKTTNATDAVPTWTPQLGPDQSLSIGALSFDPTDATNQTLLAGAGRFGSFYGRGNDRTGAWRTTDGGASWTALGGATVGLNISGAAARGAILVVSANAADSFANRGIWRSTDTGGMWTQISGAAGTGLPAGASFDLVGDPSDDARLFTNSSSNGIYRSVDTGGTWTKVSDVAVDAALAGAGNVEIAVGTSADVYVAIVTGGRLSALFRSGNAGDTWTALDVPTTTEAGVAVGIHPGAQGNTHLSIAADRTNANVVYIGGDRQPFLNEFTTGLCPCFPNSIGANDYTGRLFRVDASLAPGSQATHITHTNTGGGSSPHGDSRDMAIDANDDLVEVDDGGVFRRTTPLTNAGDWFSVIGDLRVTELHDAAWDSSAKVAIGGAQDTGTPQEVTPGDRRWQSVSTGDGGDVAVDDTGTPGMSVRYSSFQSLGSFRRRTYDTANSFVSQTFPALTVVGGGAALVTQFVTPIAVNNVTPTRLVIGGANSVYESMDQGGTITEIGPGIAVNSAGRGPIAYGATGNADVLYIGSGDDVFVRTAAPPAALTASATYPGAGTFRQVADLAIHPADPMTVFAADPTHVYTTTDSGTSWTEVTGDLPAQTPGELRSIAFSTSNAAGTVIVGADNGAFAAAGPAFNVWTPIAPGIPRVPVYDLEYDPVDEILAAGTLGRGLWTVSLAERDPVDVALVLDLSGSMLAPACPTCDTKLQVLKDAVELFVQLWTVFAVPDDRLGLGYFRTNVSEFLPGGMALFPVLPNAAAVIADVQGQTTVSTNLTAMGGGIQTAVDRLTDAARPRNVILFTDGMQNVNPMVDDTTFEIDDEPGRPASGVSPTVPPTDLDAALGRKVNTIGVGATPPFVDLLDDIASETNGLFKLTTAPDDDLRRFYVEELIDVLRTFSPQLVSYRYGTLGEGTAAEDFTTDGAARRVAFQLSWKRDTQVALRAVEKDGVDVTRAGRIVDGPFYTIWVLDLPAVAGGTPIVPAGDWRVRVAGEAGASYELGAVVDEAALDYDFSVGGRDHVVGDPIPLEVRIGLAGLPVTDARVTARVLAPRTALGTLLSTTKTPAELGSLAYEPGASDAQRKLELLFRDDRFRTALRPEPHEIELAHLGGGTYAATYSDTTVTGPYTVVYRVEGESAEIGTYRRTESRTVTVRFGRAVASASDLHLVTTRGDTGPSHELRLRPVDAAGNYLGPDYGHRIEVRLNGTLLTATPRDLLDGGYAFPLGSVADPVGTNVTVTVMEQPLYDGALAGIPGAGGGRLALSAHVGAAIPASRFPSGADPGLLAEVDLEYRGWPSVSIESVLGYYDFDGAGAVRGWTLYAKKYVPVAGAWRLFGALGPGLYRPQGGSTDVGASAAVGLNRPLGPHLELDTGAGYTHVFSSPDLGFAALRVGLKVVF
jgi:hypothetical protein